MNHHNTEASEIKNKGDKKMTIEEITTKAKELKELEAMAKQIALELESIKDELKAEMRERQAEELQADIFTIRLKELQQSRLDSKALKNDLPEMYAKYTTTSTVTRFTIS